LESTENKEDVSFRRLLTAKQMYLHGLEHSNKYGALNKMIAVHNFHNSIEIVLRSIMLHYEIRPERQLNIEFENMLNEIDNFFKDRQLRLPYRQEVRNLNQWRNLVQHHATEPESSTMDEWKVFTKRFLMKVCEEYFDLSFESLSPLELVEDPGLKEILKLSLEKCRELKFAKSLELSKIAFKLASEAIRSFLPYTSSFDIPRELEDYSKTIEKIYSQLEDEFDKVHYYSALLSSGINIVDFNKFDLKTPCVNGSNALYVSWGKISEKIDEETVLWVNDFVVNSIIQWQLIGLNPIILEKNKSVLQHVIDFKYRVAWIMSTPFE
jgi:hypothetical protein